MYGATPAPPAAPAQSPSFFAGGGGGGGGGSNNNGSNPVLSPVSPSGSNRSSTTTFTRSGRAMKEVLYDSQSHVSVLFQMYGSVWPMVLPFCVANVCITGLIFYLQGVHNIDLTFSDKGHTFMSLMVSFLVVSRSQIVYGRFMEARQHLSNAMRACREVVHHAAILTLYEKSEKAKKWRYEVAFRTILLLRVLCAVLEHQSSAENAWDIPEMDEEEHREVRSSLILDSVMNEEIKKKVEAAAARRKSVATAGAKLRGSGGASNKSLRTSERGTGGSATAAGGGGVLAGLGSSQPPPPPPPTTMMSTISPLLSPNLRSPLSPRDNQSKAGDVKRFAHGRRTVTDENFRVPVFMAYKLRQAIVSQRDGKLKEPLHVNEELKILQFVTEFNSAYHGLRKLIVTPFPFPLVQMARTFLFFWVFTLPFSLVGDIQDPPQVMIIMFLLTYGFIGLEYVSMELDDPFGDDPNDFDDLTMAQMVFEDIYITINEIDGRSAADALRLKVRNKASVKWGFTSFVAEDDFLGNIFSPSQSFPGGLGGGGGGGSGVAGGVGGGVGIGTVWEEGDEELHPLTVPSLVGDNNGEDALGAMP